MLLNILPEVLYACIFRLLSTNDLGSVLRVCKKARSLALGFPPFRNFKNKIEHLSPCISMYQIKTLLNEADSFGPGMCSSIIRFLWTKYRKDRYIEIGIWIEAHYHFQTHNIEYLNQWITYVDDSESGKLPNMYEERLVKTTLIRGSYVSLCQIGPPNKLPSSMMIYVMRDNIQDAIYAFSKFITTRNADLCLETRCYEEEFMRALEIRINTEENWLRKYGHRSFEEREVETLVNVCIKFGRWKVLDYLRRSVYVKGIFSFDSVIKGCVRYRRLQLLREISEESKEICALAMTYAVRYYRKKGSVELDGLLRSIFENVKNEIPRLLRNLIPDNDTHWPWLIYAHYAIAKSNLFMLRYFVEEKGVSPDAVFDMAIRNRDWTIIQYLDRRCRGEIRELRSIHTLNPHLDDFLKKKLHDQMNKQRIAYKNKRRKKIISFNRTVMRKKDNSHLSFSFQTGLMFSERKGVK